MARTQAKTATTRKPQAKKTAAAKRTTTKKDPVKRTTAKTATKKQTTEKKVVRSSRPKKLTLQQQADQILKKAEERGLSQNFFFSTTFKRYQVQLDIMASLETSIKEHGATVTKEYVKGRENLVANPAITEFNKTATAANGTVSTLINILKSLTDEADEKDALTEFLNG